MQRKHLVIVPIIAVATLVVFGWPRSPEVELPLPPLSEPADELADHGFADHEFVFSSVPVEQETTEVAPEARTECSRSQIDVTKYIEGQDAYLLEATAELEKSSHAEHVLAAAMLSQLKSVDGLLQLLEKAAKIDPNNPLIAWNQLQLCREQEGANCDLAKAEANARRVDSSNGAVWLQIAMLRLSEGNEDAAAEAARRAIAGPRFDSYFIDQVILIERALSTHGEGSYVDRIHAGFGFGAAMVTSYNDITTHCDSVGGADATWIDLCDQLGEKMFADSTSLLDRAIGAALRRIAAVQSGNDAEIARATAREAEFREYHQQLASSREATALLTNDEAALRRFVENFSVYGEIEAQERLHADVERLKRSPDYDQCNFVSRVVAD